MWTEVRSYDIIEFNEFRKQCALFAFKSHSIFCCVPLYQRKATTTAWRQPPTPSQSTTRSLMVSSVSTFWRQWRWRARTTITTSRRTWRSKTTLCRLIETWPCSTDQRHDFVQQVRFNTRLLRRSVCNEDAGSEMLKVLAYHVLENVLEHRDVFAVCVRALFYCTTSVRVRLSVFRCVWVRRRSRWK